MDSLQVSLNSQYQNPQGMPVTEHRRKLPLAQRRSASARAVALKAEGKDLSVAPALHKLAVVAHTGNPSLGSHRREGQTHGYPQLLRKSEAS